MTIDLTAAIARMGRNRAAIRALVEGVDSEQAGWRPDAESWSLLEVVNHLADEEAEDFRTRLDYFLHRPGEDFPPIDPQAWIRDRDYAARDLDESLARFEGERERSLAWLESLAAPDWGIERHHPVAGTMRASDMLNAWLAHDLLHLRQLIELHHGWLRSRVPEIGPGYAGEW